MGNTAAGAADSTKVLSDRLVAAKEGSSADLGMLFERYRPYLLAIALQELPARLGGKVGASDIVQESLLKSCEQFASFQGNTPEELAGWLRKILVNHLANVAEAYGAQKRQVERERPADSGIAELGRLSPSGEVLSREQWELLNGALLRLPDYFREVILLRHRENLSFVEIGRLLNKGEDAVRKTWARAIQRLQEELR